MQTYLAINLTNKKFQVGSSVQPDKRVRQHLNSEEKAPFYRSLQRDPDNFYWIVGVDDGLGESDRSDEQFYLDFFYGSRWCYNINPSATAPPTWKGKTHTSEAKKLQSESKMGDKNPAKRLEVRQKMSDSHTGVPLSNSTREAMSIAGKGRPKTEAHKQKIKESILGQTRSNESKEKMRRARLGKKTWVNEQGERKYQTESPGPEWQNGRTWKG